MPKLKEIKEALDWVAHGKLMIEIVFAVAGAKMLKTLLPQFHVPAMWVEPIEWFGGGMLLWLLLHVTRTWGQVKAPPPQSQSATALIAGNASEILSPGIDIDEFFRMGYRSPVLEQETRKNMRILARQKSPDNVEAFYLDLIGVGLLAALYDSIWYPMFRSQLLSLLEINRNGGVLALASVKVFYDDAAIAHPKEYANETFERWLSYLPKNGLILRHPSEMIEITVRGKDFLKFLTHWGREAKDKRL